MIQTPVVYASLPDQPYLKQ